MATFDGGIDSTERLNGVVAPGNRSTHKGAIETTAASANSKTYYMRAKRISTGTFVYWKSVDAPDVMGSLSGITPSDLTDILVTAVK